MAKHLWTSAEAKAARKKSSGNSNANAWATLKYWAEKFEERLPDKRNAANARLALEMFTLLLSKRLLPPETVEDSLNNANRAFDILKALEDDDINSTAEIGSNAVCMEIGPVEIQAPTKAEGSL